MIGGRFCPLRAWRTRRCGGPVDKVLAAAIAIGAALALYGVLKHLGVW